MPLILHGHDNYCGISRRKLRSGDKVIGFPAFECTRDEPEFVCYDSLVLRDVFERWELKANVVRRWSKQIIDGYRGSGGFTIMYLDENFLLVKSLLENNHLGIFFLNRAFGFGLGEITLTQYLEQITTTAHGQVKPFDNMLIKWEITASAVMIDVEDTSTWGDGIPLSFEEWLQLQACINTTIARL